MICYRCGSDHVVKNGRTEYGDQKFRCKECGRTFQIRADRYIGYEDYKDRRSSRDKKALKVGDDNAVCTRKQMTSKSKIATIFLACFGFIGIAGLHRFFTGKIKTGILFLLTFGFCGVGTAIDIVMILLDLYDDGIIFSIKNLIKKRNLK